MGRFKVWLGAGMAAIGIAGSVLVVSVAAGAVGGYPPPVPPNTQCSADSPVTVGSSAIVDLSSPFEAGSSVALELNGAPYGTLTAPGSGLIDLTLVVTDPHLAINGLGATAIPFGTETIVATGPNPDGGINTCTVLAVVSDPGGAGAASAADGGTAALAPAVIASQFKTSVPLAFTGANLVLIALLALVFLALGVALLIHARRRSHRPA
jgi:hypothetical protein